MITRQDWLKTIIKNGKEAELKGYLNKQNGEAFSDYKQIESDPSVSDAYRRRNLAVATARRLRAVDSELERMANSVTRIDRDDAGRVFGTVGLDGDAASLSISRRDAGDRVAAIDRSSELGDLLRRATRGGDEILARACAERAVELQSPEVVNQFAADRPHLSESIERVWNAERAEGGGTFGINVMMSGLRHSQFDGMSRESIDALAETEPAPEPTTAPTPPPSTGHGMYYSGV